MRDYFGWAIMVSPYPYNLRNPGQLSYVRENLPMRLLELPEVPIVKKVAIYNEALSGKSSALNGLKKFRQAPRLTHLAPQMYIAYHQCVVHVAPLS